MNNDSIKICIYVDANILPGPNHSRSVVLYIHVADVLHAGGILHDGTNSTRVRVINSYLTLPV